MQLRILNAIYEHPRDVEELVKEFNCAMDHLKLQIQPMEIGAYYVWNEKPGWSGELTITPTGCAEVEAAQKAEELDRLNKKNCHDAAIRGWIAIGISVATFVTSVAFYLITNFTK